MSERQAWHHTPFPHRLPQSDTSTVLSTSPRITSGSGGAAWGDRFIRFPRTLGWFIRLIAREAASASEITPRISPPAGFVAVVFLAGRCAPTLVFCGAGQNMSGVTAGFRFILRS